MKLSFIIPAFNEELYIRKCVESIRKAVNIASTDYEIIVVCNNCTDKTAEIAYGLRCHIVKDDCDNIAKVRNEGANNARGDYFIFVDADSQINFELFNSINFSCIGGGALVQLNNITTVGVWCQTKWNNFCSKNKIFTGNFIFVKKEVFKYIGGFNEKLYMLEDIEFSARLNQYAATFGLKTQLIQNHKLITSDRKLKLYSFFEHLWFWIKMFWNKEKMIMNRKDCYFWYEGRREKFATFTLL